MALPKPPAFHQLGVSTGTSFIWIVLTFLLPPSTPLASLVFGMLVALAAAICFAFTYAGFFASLAAYNTSNPGGEMWRVIFLVWEIGIAWISFLPVKVNGIGLNFGITWVGIFMLVIEVGPALGKITNTVDVWFAWKFLLPMVLVILAIILGVSLLIGGPDSSGERLRDADVDLLITLKRALISEAATQTNTIRPPEDVLNRFTPRDYNAAQRRGFPAAGVPFDAASYNNIINVIHYEAQEVLRQLGASKLELFVHARNDPHTVATIPMDVLGLVEACRSYIASAQSIQVIKQNRGKANFLNGDVVAPVQDAAEAADGQMVWQIMPSVLDALQRLIDILDPDVTKLVPETSEEGSTLGRLAADVKRLQDWMFNGPFAAAHQGDVKANIMLNSGRQLAFVDLMAVCSFLISALKKAEEMLIERQSISKWGKFFVNKKKVVPQSVMPPAPTSVDGATKAAPPTPQQLSTV